MQWYFAEGRQSVGPLSEQEFQSFVDRGKIDASTLVWRSGMPTWKPYGELAPAQPSEAESVTEPASAACAHCGTTHPVVRMTQFDDVWICADCKPLFVQRLKDGLPLGAGFVYGGFWIRFLAKVIDGFILWTISMIFGFGAGLVLGSRTDLYQTQTLQLFLYFVLIVVSAIYATWFLGTYGATPGKMACNLRVITPGGDGLSYPRALGRYLAEQLSALILLMEYVMAPFDAEKRTLHDHICNTRVIKQ